MTMKDFPRFSDAKIQFEVSQPQMKLLMASLSFFYESFDTQVSIDYKNMPQLVKSIQQHIMKHYSMSLPDEYIDNPDALNKELINLLENCIQDSYFSKQFEYQSKFLDEVNEMVREIDPKFSTFKKLNG